MCQLGTLLSEVEMIAADLPAKWLWRMNHDFVEAKMFLCTQMMDEARHTEVFRKRALANGGWTRPRRGRRGTLLQLIIEAKTYTQGARSCTCSGRGSCCRLFRDGRARSPPSDVEKRIFRLCMQDGRATWPTARCTCATDWRPTRPWLRTSTPTWIRARRSSP